MIADDRRTRQSREGREDGREEEGKREMTDEEIRNMTMEEAMQAFVEATGKTGLAVQYRVLRLTLEEFAQDPSLTDDQRKLLIRILSGL
jgi:hypothetical protein